MRKPAPLRCAGLHNLLTVIWRLYFNKLTKLNIQFLSISVFSLYLSSGLAEVQFQSVHCNSYCPWTGGLMLISHSAAVIVKLKAQGPFIAHLITNSKQFSQKKRQNDRIQINATVVGNTSVCCYETFGLKGDFIKGEALPLPIFAPPWIHPLEYLAQTTTRMAAFQVKAFILWNSLWLLLTRLGSTPGRI